MNESYNYFYELCNELITTYQECLSLSNKSCISNELYEYSECNAIKNLSQILTTPFVLQNDAKFSAFSCKKFSYQECVVLFRNIIDLPVLFAKSVRCCAIRSIGSIVKRVGLANNSFTRLVYETAEDFAARLLYAARVSTYLECAYLSALSKMAIDPKLQQIFMKSIENFFYTLEAYDMMTQLEVCKVAQHLNITHGRLLNSFMKLSMATAAPLEITCFASLSYVSMSMRTKSNLNKSELFNHIIRKNLLESNNPNVVKASLKIIYMIAVSSPDDSSRCIDALFQNTFIKKNTIVKERSFFYLTKIALVLGNDELIQKVLSAGITHINEFLNEKRKLIEAVTNAVAMIGIRHSIYAKQIFELFQSLRNITTYLPKMCIDFFTRYTVKHIEEVDSGPDVEFLKFDVFSDCNIFQKISDDLDLILKWRQKLRKIDGMIPISFLSHYSIGYSDMRTFLNSEDNDLNQQRNIVTMPKVNSVSEDIIVYFSEACSNITKTSSLLASLKVKVSDPTKEGRIFCAFDKLLFKLNFYAKLNFVQLLFAMISLPETIDLREVVMVIAEMHFMNKMIVNRTKTNENGRENKQQIIPRRKQSRHNSNY